MEKKTLIFTILKNLRKYLRLILIVTFLSVATVWVLLSFFLTQPYQSTSQILVEVITASNSPAETATLRSDPQVAEAYGIIIKSPEILGKVITELGLPVSINELHENIAISRSVNSQVLNITVTRMDSEEAAAIANTVAMVFKQEIPEIMRVDNIEIISTATAEKPSPVIREELMIDLGVAGVFGLVVGVLIALIIDLLNVLAKPGRRRGREKNTELQTVFK